MRSAAHSILMLTRAMNAIAGITLTLMMLLTVCDVVLRYFGKPIRGTYELIALGGAIAIGFSLPITSWFKGHIFVDFAVNSLPRTARICLHLATRLVGIGFFLVAAVFLIKNGLSMRESGEVSPTLQLPFYPVAISLGFCCLVEALVLFVGGTQVFEGSDD